MTSGGTVQTIALLANSSWNLAHFRSPIIRDLASEGTRLVAIAPKGEGDVALQAMGLTLIPVELDRGGLSPLANLALIRDYRRVLRTIRPDAILSFTIKPNIWGSIAAASLNIPVINNVSGLGTAFIGRPMLKFLVSRLYRMAFRRSSRVFFQNEDDRDLFIGDKLVRPGQTDLLPGSGIDLDWFAMTAPRTVRPFRFLFIGRLLRDKGLTELAEASRLLKGEGHVFELALLGGQDEANRSAIPPMALQQWQDEGLMVLLGQRDDIRPELANCDCVVLPSYREGMPRSILEASAMGRPVITTDVPGCRQAVDDAVTGYLCQSHNPASLADAMRRMLELDVLSRAEMGAQGRHRMEKQFSQDRVVEQYRKAIADALTSASDR